MASQSLLQISAFLEDYVIVFVAEPPDRLKCMICRKVLLNAKQTSCGCKVCERCISDYLGDSEKPCPSKQPECADTRLKLDRDIHQDNATNKEISSLKIKCPFKACTVTDSIRNMLTHVSLCDFREVKCEKCSGKYSHKEKDDHDKNKCDQRIIACQYCKSRMTAIDMEQKHHNVDSEDLCSEYLGDCPNECGKKNILLKNHMKECANQRVDCPFQLLKCSAGKLTKTKLAAHLQEETANHFNDLVSIIVNLKKKNEELTKSVDQLKALLSEQMGITNKLAESRMKSEKAIEEIKKKGPGSVSAEKNIVFRNANFIWKISDFEVLKADAESGGKASVTSDPFYTSEFGYKMCLRIYPAGDGVGRGSHLSVFFAIMKGDFDDLLSWPFKQKVTLSLLDQENCGTKNHSDTFKPDARSACYQKPIDDCNIASGSPKFIGLSSLVPSIYYKNDTIFLKISVDTIGITKP